MHKRKEDCPQKYEKKKTPPNFFFSFLKNVLPLNNIFTQAQGSIRYFLFFLGVCKLGQAVINYISNMYMYRHRYYCFKKKKKKLGD